MVDVPRPLKPYLANYREIEDAVANVIEERFALAERLDCQPVKVADEVLPATEARDLMGGESAGKWNLRAKPLAEVIEPWTSARAEAEFLAAFAALGGK